MDAEFSHGIALNSRLHFYLAPNARDSVLVDTLAAAASDPAVHVVSDSWGGGPNTSKTDPFLKATSAVFKKADAVGTTFYFSSGDTSQNSRCPLTVPNSTRSAVFRAIPPVAHTLSVWGGRTFR